MTDQFIGEIRAFGFNFAPTGWAQCNGQLMPISQNTALFSLLGTTYGGDGRTNFALPNLQGSAAMASGQGPGNPHILGEVGGAQAVTLLTSEIPQHSHALNASATTATLTSPDGPASAIGRAASPAFGPAVNLAPMGGTVGGNLPHNNMQPYLALTFCIALQGIFPARA